MDPCICNKLLDEFGAGWVGLSGSSAIKCTHDGCADGSDGLLSLFGRGVVGYVMSVHIAI
jgi:hypothetical protein